MPSSPSPGSSGSRPGGGGDDESPADAARAPAPDPGSEAAAPAATPVQATSSTPSGEPRPAAGEFPSSDGGDAPESPVPPPLARSRTIARVMDDLVRIPGTKWRVGIDPLLGLVPGTGDWIGWAISFHLMIAAAQLGAGAPLLVRMFWNILVDAVTGVVPVAGDVVDAGFKANMRNLRLLEAHVSDPSRTARASKLRVAAVLVGAGLILVGAAWGMYRLVRALLLWVF